MSTIKITQLPLITQLNANTSNTTFVAVDNEAGITGRFTGTTLAAGLYANNVLNVGNNVVTLPNTIAQFSLKGESYVQTNFVNLSDGGSADHVITANTGTDTTYFVDMGFANRYFNPGTEYNSLGTSIEPLSGYLYVQGNTSGSIGGNLIIGTTSSNTETRFIAGGGSAANVIAKVTQAGLKLVNGRTLTFDDGTVQNTAAATLAYTSAAFALANTVNVGLTYQFGVDTTQNTNIQSAWTKANNALANTSGTFNGDLNVNGNITIKGVGGIYQETASPSIMVANTSANFAIQSNIRNKIWSFSEYGTLTTPGDLVVVGNTTSNTVNTSSLSVTGSANITATLTVDRINLPNTSINNGVITTANVQSSYLIANNAVMANSVIVNDGGLLQYTTSNNSTVTQTTSKSTAVTCNGRTGQITTSNASLAKGTGVSFTVNNNQVVSAKDVIIVNLASGGTLNSYQVAVDAVAPGSFSICIVNNGAGALAETLVINFAIIRVN